MPELPAAKQVAADEVIVGTEGVVSIATLLNEAEDPELQFPLSELTV